MIESSFPIGYSKQASIAFTKCPKVASAKLENPWITIKLLNKKK